MYNVESYKTITSWPALESSRTSAHILFPDSQNSETKVYIYLTDWLTAGVEMGMNQREKKKFPQLTQQGDSVFGHMSDISSN